MRDSSSMKTLALVALAFLPGSFVAAVFSAPLFNWEAAAKSGTQSIAMDTKPQFKLFWSIALPLTALTFTLYVAMLLSKRKQMKKLSALSEEDLERILV